MIELNNVYTNRNVDSYSILTGSIAIIITFSITPSCCAVFHSYVYSFGCVFPLANSFIACKNQPSPKKQRHPTSRIPQFPQLRQTGPSVFVVKPGAAIAPARLPSLRKLRQASRPTGSSTSLQKAVTLPAFRALLLTALPPVPPAQPAPELGSPA
ncbi:hypothetical protein FUAX_54200 (plasmid) [Fulvitalea axinellae]|uniref:Uncharacterized protein n=1 Tax=Fulvitalea axinellae TaxID=1182444 RepID=A0AAU9CS95_9BACT|nr:hypothetical protein FUAX_54200 [Fulvitalea axinellae]